jgi:uncharacterized protein
MYGGRGQQLRRGHGMSTPLLLLFLREPIKGKVKTRLAAELGDEEALRVYERLLQHTLAATVQLPVRKQAWYAETPKGPAASALSAFETCVQASGDLGVRMQGAFARGFATGHSPIVIIGSDLPGMSETLLHEAFNALRTHDSVIGPAADGGYYLLGLNAPLDALFVGKYWSTSTVFEHTARDLLMHGRTCHLLPMLRDVDTAEDLAQLQLP